MARRATKQKSTGASGSSQALSNFESLGWGGVKNPEEHDLGTDLWLMARDPRLFDMRLVVGAQVKSGPSWFTKPKVDDDGTLQGWWFSADQEHWDYWLDHTIPHLVVLQDEATKVTYWAQVSHEAVCPVPGLMEALIPRKDESHGSTEEVSRGASGTCDPDGGRSAA